MRAPVALFAILAGCSDAPLAIAPVLPRPECVDGFVVGTGGGCVELVPSEECRPGTRATIGSTKCEPVGWTTPCPSGMNVHPSGWGCVDTMAKPCEGSAREGIDGKCVPVGDCGASFPPAGAIVVDGTFTDGEVDATHFKTINTAVTAAPAGATIAIAPGTYAEEVVVDRPITLQGRCPALTKIVPSSALAADPGINVQKAAGVVIRNLAVNGHIGGIAVYFGGEATIEDVVVDGAESWGIIVDESTATIRRSKVMGTILGSEIDGRRKGSWGIAAGSSDVSIDDSNVVGGTVALVAGTKDTQIGATRFVASGQSPEWSQRSAGVVSFGGRITIERAVFHDIVGDGAFVAEQPQALVTARETVARNIKARGGLARGHGAVAFGGGEVTLRNVAMLEVESVGLLARDKGSILSAFDSVVRGPPKSSVQLGADRTATTERAGVGAFVDTNATMNLENVAVLEAWGFGMYASAGGTLNATHSLIDETRANEKKGPLPLLYGVGMQVTGATATIDDMSIFRSTLGGLLVGEGGVATGRRLYVRDVKASDIAPNAAGIGAGEGGRIDLTASAVVESMTNGVFATPNAWIRLADSTVHGTRAAPQGFGHGVVVADDAEVLLERTAIFDTAAIGIVADAGRARLVSGAVARNAVAVHVQRGSFIVESADETELGSKEVRVSPETKFLENASKLGTGEIPLPSMPLP